MAYRLLEDEDLDAEPQENAVLSFGKELGRHATRTASNLGTLAVGIPGDIFSLINDAIAKPATEYLSGEPGLPYEETSLGKVFPTTETHRKGMESLLGEGARPQNQVEKFVDDVVDIAATISNPTRLAKKGFQAGANFIKPLAKSVVANLLGESAKGLTESEGAGAGVKLGSLVLMSLFDKEAAAKQVGKLYREAESQLPPTATTSATVLQRNLNNLEHSITKGRPRTNLSAPETFVMRQIDNVNNLIQNGQIVVQQGVAQKRSLNQELSNLYQVTPKGTEQKAIKSLAKQINGYLNQTIEDYGKTNPGFIVPYKNADKAFGTLAQSNFVTHWIQENVTHNPITHGLLHLFGPVQTALAGTAASVGAPIATGATLAGYQAVKLLYRINNSPVLRKIYGTALKEAATENAGAFNRSLKQLDEKLQEEESQDKYRFID
jgi:hypothetical protein